MEKSVPHLVDYTERHLANLEKSGEIAVGMSNKD